jgi:hypothetical protein
LNRLGCYAILSLARLAVFRWQHPTSLLAFAAMTAPIAAGTAAFVWFLYPPADSTHREHSPQSFRRYTDEGALDAVSPIICVLHGLGGIGKTQLALQYYYEHRGECDAAFWVDAEHPWALAESFTKIADKLDLLPRRTTDPGGHEVHNQAVEASRNWLQNTCMSSIST